MINVDIPCDMRKPIDQVKLIGRGRTQFFERLVFEIFRT